MTSQVRDCQPQGRRWTGLLALVATSLLLALGTFATPAAAHDVPSSARIFPRDQPWQPGDRYRPYYPEDAPYAVHYRPYVPRTVRRQPVRHYHHVAKRPAAYRHAKVYRKPHPQPLPTAQTLASDLMPHDHVRTRILRPRVTCGTDYNYWGPERLCELRR